METKTMTLPENINSNKSNAQTINEPNNNKTKGNVDYSESLSEASLEFVPDLNKITNNLFVFVRYYDHVLFNRSCAMAMQPQKREAIGWLVYECDRYVILAWDRDNEPPTLHGGDAKASGLVLLKSDIIILQKLVITPSPLQKNFDWALNCAQPIQDSEYAFRPSERKTHSTTGAKKQ
jgi:hypothetical protein